MEPKDSQKRSLPEFIPEDELIRMATVDAATGLDARQFFDYYAPSIFEKVRTSGQRRISAIMIDVDNLRVLNSRLGHIKTDKVLEQIGEVFKNNLRLQRGDKVARYGGDEIVALLPNTNRKGATVAARRLVQKVRELAYEINVPVTISAGASEIDPRYGDLETLLQRADEACYKAKEKKDRHLTYRVGQ